MLDFLEPHIWMTSYNDGEFYNEVGYDFDLFETTSYRNLASKGEGIYYERKKYWQKGLTDQIAMAAKSGRWLAISTSNFCGPQFVGMWRDKEWHRRLTGIIHGSKIAPELKASSLARRMEYLANR